MKTINKENEKLLNLINDTFPKKKNSLNLSAKEVGIFLGVSTSTIENLRKNCVAIDYIKIGNRYLYPKENVIDYIIGNKIKVT